VFAGKYLLEVEHNKDKKALVKSGILFLSYSKRAKGASINDVTVLGGRGGQGLCDNITKPLVIKCVTMEGGGS
jgi:hypothetical protein